MLCTVLIWGLVVAFSKVNIYSITALLIYTDCWTVTFIARFKNTFFPIQINLHVLHNLYKCLIVQKLTPTKCRKWVHFTSSEWVSEGFLPHRWLNVCIENIMWLKTMLRVSAVFWHRAFDEVHSKALKSVVEGPRLLIKRDHFYFFLTFLCWLQSVKTDIFMCEPLKAGISFRTHF